MAWILSSNRQTTINFERITISMRHFLLYLLVLLFSIFNSVGQEESPQAIPQAEEPLPRYRCGMLIDEARDSLIPLIYKPDGYGENLPSSASLEDFVPDVQEQGWYGTSPGWAAAYYTATTEWALITNQNERAFINLFAYDPIYHNKTGQPNTSGCSDAYLADVLLSMVERDAKRMNIDKSECAGSKLYTDSYSLLEFMEVFRLTSPGESMMNNVNSVKQAIVDMHPVVFGFEATEALFQPGYNGLFQPTENDEAMKGYAQGHAMTVVGYDDEMFGGAFRVVNSWGTMWGDQGYCWIRYHDFNNFLVAAYVFNADLKKPDLVAYGAEKDGFGRKKIKKYGFFEGFLDAKGNPDKGIYINRHFKKGRGGFKYMQKLIELHGGELIYSEDNDEIPVAAIIY